MSASRPRIPVWARSFRLWAGLAVAGLAAWGWILMPGASAPSDAAGSMDYVPVRRGALTISIEEDGTIVSREQYTVATDLSEDTTFLWLIDEGSEVREGDLLAELDATYFTDRKNELEIELMANQSALARAENELTVARNESEAELSQADVDYRLAALELTKFTEGEVPQQRLELKTAISLAREERERAEDKLTGSRELEARGFITGSELQADILAATRARIALQLAEGSQRIYEAYTLETELATRTTDAEQKKLALERVRHKAESRLQLAETKLANQQALLQRRQSWYRRLERDIANCRLVAPADGLVVYASTVRRGWHYDEPFAAGREVDERQDVFYIPSSGLRNAEFAVHESHLERVATGMPARVRVEAVPHVQFNGIVVEIAGMPQQEEQWQNANLRSFQAQVALQEDDKRLRTGMSCQIDVVLYRYDDVLHVPAEAVTQQLGQSLVYVRGRGGSPEPRPVRVGQSDARMTAILEGLDVGDEVLRSPPLATGEILTGNAGEPASHPGNRGG